MKVIAINGSPRKSWNTAMMLDSALEGAKAAGAEGKRVDLYDLKYRGCVSCFECKRLGGKSFGHCALKDELQPVLEECLDAEVLLLGSPIYFNDLTGMMRSFIERLYFPILTYTKAHTLLRDKIKNVGWIFTTNAPGDFYPEYFKSVCASSERFLGPTEYLCASETLQFTDYSLYAADMFDVPQRLERREKVFPLDLTKAKEMGERLVKEYRG